MNEQLKIIISAEIDKFKQNVDKAQKQISNFKEQVAKASKDVDDKFKGIGEGIAKGAKAAAVGLAAAGTALVALGASTQEYRNEQAKLTTAFETAGSSAAQAKETYNDLFRVLGDSGQATEAANHLAKLTTEEKALNEWTTICQGVYATFGDSLPIEGLTEAANETAKVGTLTGSLADALNWAGVNEDAFQEKLDKCNSEAEREQLIRKTLNGLYDDAAAKYEENNAQVLAQNEAQARLQETTAALGEVVAPLVTSFTQFATDALAIVVPYVQQLAQEYGPALQSVLEGVAAALEAAFTWAIQHKEILLVVGGLVAGIATAIGLYNVVAAVKAAMDAAQVTTLWALVSAYAAQAAAMIVAIAPYLAIVAAIAAVIAIIVLCVKHWDKIKEATIKVWEKMKEAVKSGIDATIKFFNKVISFVKDNWQGLLLLIVNPFAGAFKLAYDNCEGFRTKVNSIFGKIKDSIKEKLTDAKNTVKSIVDAIVGFFTGAKFKWPSIKMPKFSISPAGWKIGDLLEGKIPKLSIAWNAKGAVFDKPTLLNYGGSLQGVGEDGAEMLMPLENNLEWLDKLAGMLTDRMGGNTPIVLQVDGKVFAQTAIKTINQNTRQTGKLALNLV